MGLDMGPGKHLRINKARIGPVQCYFEGKELLGEQYALFLGITLVGVLIAGVVPVILYGPSFCGIALCFLKLVRGERVVFEQLFKGFDYFVPSLIATLFYIGGVMLLAVPFMIFLFSMFAMMASQNEVLMLIAVAMLVVCYVGWILIVGLASLVFMFAVLLIVDKDLDGPAAMQLALKGCLKNFWGVVGSAFVGQLIVFVGTMMCIVPGFLALPIVFAGHVIVYRKIFDIEMTKPIMAQPVGY